jgi:hypothetical protein
MKTYIDNKRIKVSGDWPALAPALSPRRGRIVVSRSAKQARLEIASGVLCCSLSPGERVRARAGVPIHFEFRPVEFGFYN